MKSLTTIFKQVYGEALAPYGFQKIKGRQPYFVRRVGEEIIHVITYTNYPSLKDGYKEFSPFGGVATVYRPKINLDIAPRDNVYWIDSNMGFYRKADPYGEKPDISHEWYTFSYEKDNEESMIESVKYSLDITKQVMLPILSQATSLKSCIDYFRQFSSSLLYIYDDEEFGMKHSSNECNEALINVKVLSVDEYAENRKADYEKYNKRMLYLIEKGRPVFSDEEFEKQKVLQKEGMQKQIALFENLVKDPEKYQKVIEELEHRKNKNLEILKNYGLEV